jgi:hypothetical protein
VLIASRDEVSDTIFTTLCGNSGRFGAFGITTTAMHDNSYTTLDFVSLFKLRHCTRADRASLRFVGHFDMALKGSRRRATTSLYLIESREAEQKLAEAREKKKAIATKPAKPTKNST